MADDATMAALEKVLATYKTGGEFEKQRTSQLSGMEKKYTGQAKSSLVSSGLQGTTIGASIPQAFEQEIGGAFRTETERLRSGSEMQALLAKAGFAEADRDRQLKLTMQQSDLDAQAKAQADAIAAGKYSDSMAAAASVHGGGGGGGGGGGTGSTFDTGTDSAAMWARRIQGSGGGSTGGASTHIGGSGSFGTGGYGSGSAGSYGGGDVEVSPGVQSGGQTIETGQQSNDPISRNDPSLWEFHEYYPGGPQYSINKKTGVRRP